MTDMPNDPESVEYSAWQKDTNPALLRELKALAFAVMPLDLKEAARAAIAEAEGK